MPDSACYAIAGAILLSTLMRSIDPRIGTALFEIARELEKIAKTLEQRRLDQKR